MTERRTLPVLALRETVVFPHVAVPISAGRPGTVQAIEAAMANDRRLFAVCQVENRDEIEGENLHGMGVVVKIVQVQRAPGVLQLLIQGERRARPLEYQERDEMLEAVVERTEVKHTVLKELEDGRWKGSLRSKGATLWAPPRPAPARRPPSRSR